MAVRRSVTGAATLIGGVLLCGPALGAVVYDLTGITAPGAAQSRALGLNNRGDVVGSLEFDSAATGSTGYAFVYSNGVLTKFTPGLGGVAFAINDNGIVVGSMGVNIPSMAPTSHAFSYSAGQLNDLGGQLNSNPSAAYAINNSGQIVGITTMPVSGSAPGGYILASSATGWGVNLGFGLYSGAFSINQNGSVVGERFDTTTPQNPSFTSTPGHLPRRRGRLSRLVLASAAQT